MRHFTPEKRGAILADVRDGLPYDLIMTRHNVSKNAVSQIALKAGLRRQWREGMLTEVQVAEVVARYKIGERAQDIAVAFGMSSGIVWATLQRAGVAARGPVEAHTRLPLRHDALDVLTPDAAYWCGFLFTDGSVVRQPNKSPCIAVVLKASDREHLVKFRSFLGSGHAITSIKPAKVKVMPGVGNGGQGTGAVRVAVNSAQLAERLESLGRYGPAVDPELTASRDFWRGCVDGDGTVGISCGIPQVKLVGSKWLLGAFVDFLGPVSSRRPLNVRPARSIYVVSTSYATAEKVAERLYAGATTALDRKAAAAAAILAGA